MTVTAYTAYLDNELTRSSGQSLALPALEILTAYPVCADSVPFPHNTVSIV
jgi:hypothetical protein